jgi:hypothetical protein
VSACAMIGGVPPPPAHRCTPRRSLPVQPARDAAAETRPACPPEVRASTHARARTHKHTHIHAHTGTPIAEGSQRRRSEHSSANAKRVLHLICCPLRGARYTLSVVRCVLRGTCCALSACCLLSVECNVLHDACCQLKSVAWRVLHNACCQLHAAWRVLRNACCTLSVARCLLHVVCCTLPVACCLLHVVCRALSVCYLAGTGHSVEYLQLHQAQPQRACAEVRLRRHAQPYLPPQRSVPRHAATRHAAMARPRATRQWRGHVPRGNGAAPRHTPSRQRTAAALTSRAATPTTAQDARGHPHSLPRPAGCAPHAALSVVSGVGCMLRRVALPLGPSH